MRVKEGSADYRYFPEPDLPNFEIDDSWIEAVRSDLPAFPKERRAKYKADFGLSDYDAKQLTATKNISDFFEAAVAAGGDAKSVSNWLQGEVAQYLNAEGETIEEIGLTPVNLTEMLSLVADGTISSKIAKKSLFIWRKMVVQPRNTLKKLAWCKFLIQHNYCQSFRTFLLTMKKLSTTTRAATKMQPSP